MAALQTWERKAETNTRAELARQTELSPSGVSAIFNGRVRPSKEKMALILEQLDDVSFCEVLRAYLLDEVMPEHLPHVSVTVSRDGAAAEGPTGDEFEDNLGWLAQKRLEDAQLVAWFNHSVRIFRRNEKKFVLPLAMGGLLAEPETSEPSQGQERVDYPRAFREDKRRRKD
jgi:transcriptional regulator with XRE-family HTH domain